MFTWADLKKVMDQMTEQQLKEPVELIPYPSYEEPIELHAIIACNTVKYFFDNGEVTRSTDDNKHHPDRYVLLTDGNPFDANDNSYWTATAEGLVGNKTGEIRPW